MNKKQTSPEKVTTSFRIAIDDMSKLCRESEKKGISANTLVSQIIKQHVDWHSRTADAGLISISKHILQKLLEFMDTKKLIEIAQTVAKNKAKSMILMLRGEFTPDSWLDSMEMWAQANGFAFREEIKGTRQNILIQHDLGTKFSVLVRELQKTVFSELGIEVEIQITDDSVIVNFENSKGTS